ncbi:cytochrome c oxidase assembly protein [Pseudomonas luteola]|uniref:Cytochrome c oxidase assembly protein n=1 Tax=Pseudomonas luteola TaxID=47886 RepID=A0ABS0FTN4_PSELU|nr:cytochrome c oxidase assembly protein [Pseudomonas zeshuii]MBF8643748.1 cytochrome c oxidase assembly protein [Pseudomonas zeshuii]
MKRRVSLLIGLLLLAVTWLGPLPALAAHSFTAHMSMHVLVIAAVAPLLALGTAQEQWDPVIRWPFLFSPVLASLIELVVVWVWHTPVLHHAARHVPFMLILEQGSYLIVGLLVWLAAFGGLPSDRQARAAGGIAGLLMTSMHMTLLGVLLAMADRVLYPHAGLAPFGLTSQQDQQLGGVIMLVFGGTSYLVGGLYLLAGLLGKERDHVSTR